jgi:anaerobic selenocysteine-containing dehydrogenase
LKEVGNEIISSDGKKEPEQFLLIGRRHVRSNNSWMHNVERLVKGKDRCTLMMNEEDARKLEVTDDQKVRVSSRVGEVVVSVEISNKIMPGIVSLPHGYGHNRGGTRMSTAEANAGVSINDLTDDQQIDPLTGNAAFSGQPVRISLIP